MRYYNNNFKNSSFSKNCKENNCAPLKINFREKKENVVCSLYNVEKFLHQATKIAKGLKFYSFFK